MTHLEQPPLVELEETIQEKINSIPILRQNFFVAPKVVYDFINLARELSSVGKHEDIKESDLASQVLLSQIQQEYRACQIMASLSYASAAASIACSIYENFYIMTSILDDDFLAEKWREHGFGEEFSLENLKHPPKELVFTKCRKDFYQRLHANSEIDQAKALENSKDVYTNLCSLKHGNPTTRNKLGYSIYAVDNGRHDIVITSAPVFGAFQLQSCAYSLYHAGRYAINAASGYAFTHGSLNNKEVIGDRRNADIQYLVKCITETREYLKTLGNETIL